MTMEPVIQPIDRKLIINELTKDKFIGTTRRGGNFLYEITHKDSPQTMREIGRLREISFRLGGGGTGKSLDIDKFDTDEHFPYRQLIVWDPDEQEIVGGYRYIVCGGVNPSHFATSELFNFSDKFKNEYLPWTIELGRSFIQPNYQSSNISRKSIFALDNLWDGLGALVVKYDKVKYLFGKVTMYTSYNVTARNILLNFLNRYFPDKEELVTAFEPIDCNTHDPYINSLFEGLDYKEGYKVMVKELKDRGEKIPPLINSYMNLSQSMRIFETAINAPFGGVEETGMLINVTDIYIEKSERHVTPFRTWKERVKMNWWKIDAKRKINKRKIKKSENDDSSSGGPININLR